MKTNQSIKPVSKRIRIKRNKSILNKSEETVLFPEKLAMAEEILKKFPVPENLLKLK